jgi:hypothetical protein
MRISQTLKSLFSNRQEVDTKQKEQSEYLIKDVYTSQPIVDKNNQESLNDKIQKAREIFGIASIDTLNPNFYTAFKNLLDQKEPIDKESIKAQFNFQAILFRANKINSLVAQSNDTKMSFPDILQKVITEGVDMSGINMSEFLNFGIANLKNTDNKKGLEFFQSLKEAIGAGYSPLNISV